MTTAPLDPAIGQDVGVVQKSLLATSPTKDGTSLGGDLEAWLNHEIEKPCETWTMHTDLVCGAPADWLFVFSKDCDCPNTSNFQCDFHKERWLAVETQLFCDKHLTPAHVRLVERIR